MATGSSSEEQHNLLDVHRASLLDTQGLHSCPGQGDKHPLLCSQRPHAGTLTSNPPASRGLGYSPGQLAPAVPSPPPGLRAHAPSLPARSSPRQHRGCLRPSAARQTPSSARSRAQLYAAPAPPCPTLRISCRPGPGSCSGCAAGRGGGTRLLAQTLQREHGTCCPARSSELQPLGGQQTPAPAGSRPNPSCWRY